MITTASFVPDVPDIIAFEGLLLDYYTGIGKVLEAAGGPSLTPQDMVDSSIAHLADMLPPNGRLALIHDQDERLVGCGALLRIREDAAELKRMFVTPEAQGLGLGRKLFEMRIEEARKMGCRTLYADTVKGNRSMLAMYEKYGFQNIPRYPENANPPELAPYLVYMEYKLPA